MAAKFRPTATITTSQTWRDSIGGVGHFHHPISPRRTSTTHVCTHNIWIETLIHGCRAKRCPVSKRAVGAGPSLRKRWHGRDWRYASVLCWPLFDRKSVCSERCHDRGCRGALVLCWPLWERRPRCTDALVRLRLAWRLSRPHACLSKNVAQMGVRRAPAGTYETK